MGRVSVRKAVVAWGMMTLCCGGSRWAPGERHCEALGLPSVLAQPLCEAAVRVVHPQCLAMSGANPGQSVRKDVLRDGGFLF